MTTFPSEIEQTTAVAILDDLISGGADPQLLPDGSIKINGPATPDQSAWVRAHREAFRGCLVSSGRFTPGTLDRIYGFTDFVRKEK